MSHLDLEKRRSLLEDLEIIENAISTRFQRNPELYYSNLKKVSELFPSKQVEELPTHSIMTNNKIYKTKKLKRNRKQIALQQHEISLFIKDFFSKQKELETLTREANFKAKKNKEEILLPVEEFKDILSEINEADGNENGNRRELEINDKINKYSMFSNSLNKSHPSTILSSRASDLDINSIFSLEEQYGEYLALNPYYTEWLNVVKKEDLTFLQFLNMLKIFQDDKRYIVQPPMDRKNEPYMKYLQRYCSYLESFFERKYPLIDSRYTSRELKKEFNKSIIKPLENEKKGFFCKTCCKWFKTLTVFESHLNGQKHIKSYNKRVQGLYAEYKTHRYSMLLKEEHQSTCEFVERKMAFTVEERITEMKRLAEICKAPAYDVNEKEGDENNTELNVKDNLKNDGASAMLSGSINMPLGPDGLPMPFWLYKLQGLDVSYPCEICSNQIFKGRRTFDKHFTEATHIYHLRCLGIEPTPAFKGVTKIEEAQRLWNNMKNDTIMGDKKFIETIPDKMAIEVEDKEGNIMTQKVYDELKKQGLA
ncbi:SF3a splicing factor complex subunit PRP9 NDAI_0G02890 [Naumovozyma dairenensis CBS 421]|uniref:C2H2-type domain-containing protein n=1 Tax=Naumovozyma dairenensis (strain ATCC 10597 / BCRC 20456 / CBS 421 / NBRC 0211 / NRRL Y-12639) TaxID=1071378 RepID=G0WE55_NAUDC|nr:hypothetical protein NDAI_0G02890 [Naumovozyma dairenensis CBS 421]CCD26066.2 hypothetical protein NDAI_0G02890 [Naumovozyma dairenensis CBS 421]